MIKTLGTFIVTEDGAVTVDMTLLMAALIGLCLSVMTVIEFGLKDISVTVSDTVSTRSVDSTW